MTVGFPVQMGVLVRTEPSVRVDVCRTGAESAAVLGVTLAH